MIEDDVVRARNQSDAVVLLGRHISEAAAQVSDDDIMSCDHKSEIAQTDTITRRCLSGNRDERISDD